MNYIKLFENSLKNIDYNRIFTRESEFVDWFKNNCHLLGCKVLSESKNLFPDAIIQKDGITIRTEFETLSSNFILHGHDPSKVDLVICICNNKNLPVEILELPFIFEGGRFYSGYTISESQKLYKEVHKMEYRESGMSKTKFTMYWSKFFKNISDLDSFVTNFVGC